MKQTHQGLDLHATDLAKHLGCRHLTELDRAVAEGRRPKSDWASPMLKLLQARGFQHEEDYIQTLRDAGREITDLGEFHGNVAEQRTIHLMHDGADVIVQAALRDGRWSGRADVLLRVPLPDDPERWTYEVVDTKLAQETRGGTVLQLCLYADLVGHTLGHWPELMHVVKPGPGFPQETFRYDDYSAYYRRVRDRLRATIEDEPAATYPMPVPQCDACAWWKHCDQQRHDDDHLCLVAGLSTMHIHELNRQGVTTLQQFAEQDAPLTDKPRRGRVEAYEKAQDQARVQLEGRKRGQPYYRLLPVEPGEGLARLPEPDPGDVFFDFEADPFVDGGGLEYLFGFVTIDTGTPKYECWWALDHDEERRVFERFMDFVTERRRRFPGMHVYHFGHYEPSALKRLMGRHATRAQELDWLLRGERFINLHAVTRRGLRCSVESYSLKNLEPFCDYQRSLALPDASAALRRVEASLELGHRDGVRPEDQDLVREYNREDCEATWKLRDWLEERREEAIADGETITRPELKDGNASEEVEERDAEIQAVFTSLVDGLPEDRETWTDEHRATWLLAHQLEYFVREDKCAWWEFFRLHELEHDELLDERKAVTGLRFEAEVDGGTAKCPAHQYRIPPQEVSLRENDKLDEVGGDPVGKVLNVDPIAQTLVIKKRMDARDVHPHAVLTKEGVPRKPLDTSLLALAKWIAEHGLDGAGKFRAARDLLLKRPPHFTDGVRQGPLRNEGEEVVDAAKRLAAELDRGVLPVQGPPGTGKTYAGARTIVALARAGRRVGITAVSHKVILNLLKEVRKAAAEAGVSLRLVHKSKPDEEEPEGIEQTNSNEEALEALANGAVVGGTAWLWARDDAVERVDTLVIDEAGQMSLVHTLAAARCAHNLILLGDPQQLEQPQRGAHPEGSDAAALDHVLDGARTLAPDRGLFLDVTWRLHPAICRFTSSAFYEGRLGSKPGLEQQAVVGDTPLAGSGLVFVPVSHEGNQTTAPEEVQVVADLVSGLLAGAQWRDADGEAHAITLEEVLIVAPYNAQVAALTAALTDGARVGTVDRFQGQQAPVVIYSMTSSTAEDAPRGMEFLFSPNRLNVATSRARCVSVMVASPRLLEAECRVPRQMLWTNGVCWFGEVGRVMSDGEGRCD